MIYFAKCDVSGLTKIGFAKTVSSRMRTLQTGSAGRLTVVATVPGNIKRESALHGFFESSRVRGEWFRLSDYDVSLAVIAFGNVSMRARECDKCSRPVTATRKGLCTGCYMRDWRGHHVTGPCAACGEAELRKLILARFPEFQGRLPICGNCSTVRGRRTITLAQLRCEMARPGKKVTK